MTQLRVGYPHTAGQARWSPGTIYSFDEGEHCLDLFVSGVSASQVADLTSGLLDLALVIDEDRITVCSRFGETIPWTHAAPFHWRRL
ncbi:hypothetical protein [Singulisphaera sp. PoT]|uniref:hypothetical protein n=1 Tax=Singulisphaera sp. PoT TaxID=3411797 RepID=UPI003BF465A7